MKSRPQRKAIPVNINTTVSQDALYSVQVTILNGVPPLFSAMLKLCLVRAVQPWQGTCPSQSLTLDGIYYRAMSLCQLETRRAGTETYIFAIHCILTVNSSLSAGRYHCAYIHPPFGENVSVNTNYHRSCLNSPIY